MFRGKLSIPDFNHSLERFPLPGEQVAFHGLCKRNSQDHDAVMLEVHVANT